MKRQQPLELFKYFFYKSKYKKSLIIVDDIESAEYVNQVEIIKSLFKSYNCAKNIKEDAKIINIIIYIRPNTFKILGANNVKEMLNSHSTDISIYIRKPVYLAEIFEKRFNEVLSRSDYKHIKNKEELKRALDVLLYLCNSISDRYSNRFIALFNYNIRRTLTEFNQIIVNRKWFQKGKSKNPSFKIDELDYAISESAVYRVLGLRNSDYYPYEKTCLPNILYNKQHMT